MLCHPKTRHCVNLSIVNLLNYYLMTSREQRLITKEHIATYTNLILLFKPALYSSSLVIKYFKKVEFLL